MDPRPDDPDEPHGSDEPTGAVPSPPPAPTPDDAAAPPPFDADAAFRAIVEGYSRSSETPVPPWPVEEDVDPEPKRRRSDDPSAAPRVRRRPEPPEGALPGWVEPAPVEDDNHYVPPPPPPAPRLRPRTLAAAGAVLLGIVLLFAPALLDVAPGAGTSFLGILLTGGGAGALVYWMRDTPGPPDDGAVV